MTKVKKKTKLKRGRSPLQFHQFSEFSTDDWEEIKSATGAIWPVGKRKMTRPQWLVVGQILLGMAQLIGEGRYDMPLRTNYAVVDRFTVVPTKVEVSKVEQAENVEWAAHLRRIAAVIHDRFKPGDGVF